MDSIYVRNIYLSGMLFPAMSVGFKARNSRQFVPITFSLDERSRKKSEPDSVCPPFYGRSMAILRLFYGRLDFYHVVISHFFAFLYA